MHRSAFALDPEVTFLNHGSFGACPRAVLKEQDRWRQRLEAEPVRFFLKQLPEGLRQSREALASFVGADAEGLVFVRNATEGVNSVMRSLRFEGGDEILTTNHIYNACGNVLDFVAQRAGARVIVVDLPIPLAASGPEDIETKILAHAGPRTVIALLDHITSATGIVMPIASLVSRLQGRGVDVLVDGAHGPGMVPLQLDALGAAYYTGNLHKWVSAPKSVGFLHVRADRREGIRPAVISHGANSPTTHQSRFQLEFDWPGTQDPSAMLALPIALKTLSEALPEGWPGLMRRNRELALQGKKILEERVGLKAVAPDSMIGSLVAMQLPTAKEGSLASTHDACDPFAIHPIQETLWREHRIEVPVFPFGNTGRSLIRISAHLYNEIADYKKLAEALVPLL